MLYSTRHHTPPHLACQLTITGLNCCLEYLASAKQATDAAKQTAEMTPRLQNAVEHCYKYNCGDEVEVSRNGTFIEFERITKLHFRGITHPARWMCVNTRKISVYKMLLRKQLRIHLHLKIKQNKRQNKKRLWHRKSLKTACNLEEKKELERTKNVARHTCYTTLLPEELISLTEFRSQRQGEEWQSWIHCQYKPRIVVYTTNKYNFTIVNVTDRVRSKVR